MKKISALLISLIWTYLVDGATWFEKNRELEIIFPASVWKYVEKAREADDQKRVKIADSYLRLALRLTEEARPFVPGNWPQNWPWQGKPLQWLRYATPEAYFHRIIGDFALDHQRSKEAIAHYRIYLEKSIVPDVSVMHRLATLLEREGLFHEAVLMWNDMQRAVEDKNYHGQVISPTSIIKAIKRLETKLRRGRVLILDTDFSDVPEYLQNDFNRIYRQAASSLKGLETVAEEDFARILSEQGLTTRDLIDDGELARVSKMLNASLVVRCFLSRGEGSYVIVIRLFDPMHQSWFAEYEYRNQDFRYLPVLVRRFPYSFLEEKLPSELLLPVTEVQWNYETESEITDIRIANDGSTVICGTESGDVYVFDHRGRLVTRKKMNDRITQVGISPDGQFFSWACLNGKVYFQGRKTRSDWVHSFNNLVRGLAVAKEGHFMVVGVNNGVWFLDSKGTIFWKTELNRWVKCVSISPQATRVGIGMEDGRVLCYSEEGNQLWEGKAGNKTMKIGFSPRGDFLVAETDTGEVVVFGSDGKPVFNLVAGEEKKFVGFSPDMFSALTGRRGRWFYFISENGRNLWNFEVDEKTVYLEAAQGGQRFVAAANKNIFYVAIKWE
ncbi:MAG: WD40 repeat domain-containing protein [Candidatus Omnitrophica bacterium]|nr:WD40 repeat domain-containing protein [Candidatus Omnitrophota bacterium]